MKHRSRILRAGFFTNELLAEIDPHARLLFAGLWLLADREGRLEDRPSKIRGVLFPYEVELNVNALLCQLSKKGFIVRYRVDNSCYIEVINFKEHQQVYHNEADSVIPSCKEENVKYSKLSSSYRVAYNKNKNKKEHKNKNKKEHKNKQKKEKEHKNGEIPFSEILDDLNEKAGTNYRPTTQITIDKIRARWNEGFRLIDFKIVNSKKVAGWLGSSMAKFIRPETLYGNKFEGYLNEIPEDNRFSDTTKHNLTVIDEWLKEKREQCKIAN